MSSNGTKFKELFNSSSKKTGEFLKILSTIFIRILDKIVNGFTMKEKGVSVSHKYYTYFISIVLILILSLFYYLNEKQNLFTIKNTKYEILVAILLIAFSIYCFLFFVYRNQITWIVAEDVDKDVAKDIYNSGKEYASIYTQETRKLIDITDTNSATLNKDNLKKTLTSPLFNIMKYLFYLLLILIIPLFLLNYTFYMHNVNNNVFNITKNIIILLIILTVLAIIAKLFSIKTSSRSIYCEIDTTGKPEYTNLIKSYSKYFLCIFKNFVFFIPCLLVILTDEINNDIRLTPSSVYILFFILLLINSLSF